MNSSTRLGPYEIVNLVGFADVSSNMPFLFKRLQDHRATEFRLGSTLVRLGPPLGVLPATCACCCIWALL